MFYSLLMTLRFFVLYNARMTIYSYKMILTNFLNGLTLWQLKFNILMCFVMPRYRDHILDDCVIFSSNVVRDLGILVDKDVN